MVLSVDMAPANLRIRYGGESWPLRYFDSVLLKDIDVVGITRYHRTTRAALPNCASLTAWPKRIIRSWPRTIRGSRVR